MLEAPESPSEITEREAAITDVSFGVRKAILIDSLFAEKTKRV